MCWAALDKLILLLMVQDEFVYRQVNGCSPSEVQPQSRRRKRSVDENWVTVNIILEHDLHIPDTDNLTNEHGK